MKLLKRTEPLRKQAFGRPFGTAFILGAIYYAVRLSWLAGTDSSDVISNRLMGLMLSWSSYVITVSVFALGGPLFIVVWRRLNLHIVQRRVLWLVPAIWVVCELTTSVLFSIISYGDGGRIGDFWKLGSPGALLINTPLVFGARLGGLYLLSALSAGIVIGIVRTVKTKKWWSLVPVCLLATTLSLVGWNLYSQPNGRSLQIAALTLKAQQDSGSGNLRASQAFSGLPGSSVETVVMPEYSHYFEADRAQESTALRRVFLPNGGLVIDSQENPQNGQTANEVRYSNVTGSTLFSQTKWFLIPGGEFVPYFYKFMMRALWQQTALAQFERYKTRVPGASHEQPFTYQGVTYGGLACSAVNVPTLYRQLANSGAEILTNSASLNTLGGQKGYHLESQVLAKFQAVANARPFVQSARGGNSFIYDSSGRLLARSQRQTDTVIVSEVMTNKQKTMYTKLGDWPLLFAVIMIVGSLIGAKRTNRKHLHIPPRVVK